VNGLESLTVCEVEPAVIEAEKLFKTVNGEPLRAENLKSGKVRVLVEDARTILRFDDTKYDVIISQPSEPWLSGSSDLYTCEFWKLASARLKEKGVFCQWIQLYSIDPVCLGILCRTFQNVFPATYVIHSPDAGEVILIGANPQAFKPLRVGQTFTLTPLVTSERIDDLAKSVIIDTPDDLSKICNAVATKCRDNRLNTDDNLLSEYMLPARLYKFGESIEMNLRLLTSARN
jgi:spermidine synthase